MRSENRASTSTGLESVRPMTNSHVTVTEPCSLQDVPHLIGPERPQQAGHPTLVAAAFKLHRRAPEQPHVLGRKATLEQLLDRTLQQISGT